MNFSSQLPFNFSISAQTTFANFLISPKNRELVRLLQHIQAEDELFMYIWGSSATGKTHLLQALCHECEEAGNLQALYLPMEKIKVFGPEVFNSLHHMDMICLDDVDRVIGNKDWEERLFEFFNRSREAGVRLVVTAQNAPRGLPFALQDLASRMTWGVIYQLHELDDEEKLAALGRRAKEKHMPLPMEVLQYIYQRHPRDLQSLLDVLNRLDTLSLAEKRRLTIPFVRQVMDWN